MQCLFPSTTCLLVHYVAVATITMALDEADGGRAVVENRSYIWMFKESQCGIQRPVFLIDWMGTGDVWPIPLHACLSRSGFIDLYFPGKI